jgi:hypothetical protein
MAKGGRGRKRGNESVSGWFRNAFTQHPEWLRGRSNAAVMEQWQADHPGQSFGASERNACNNVKSLMRKRQRRRGRKPASEGGGAVPAVRVSRSNLELLEEHIDDCMSMARTLDKIGLELVVKLLRRARNEVVWKQGQ